MANRSSERGKRRTRQHVIEAISIHHVEGFILQQGYTVQRIGSDYGYDLHMATFDDEGYAEPGAVYFQVKASEALLAVGTDYVFDVDVRDYNLWIREEMPVILVLYDATRQEACWLPVQRYFEETQAQRPQKGAKTIRVRIPKTQVLDQAAVGTFRSLKPESQSE